MKFRILLAGILLASCGSVVRGSGCTNLTYPKTGDDKIYAYDSLGVQYIQKETVTYTVTCTSTVDGSTVLGPVSNATTAYGTTGCLVVNMGCHDFPCNPQFGTVVTPGDSFDNQAFNGAVANNTSFTAACTPGPLQQDNATVCPYVNCNPPNPGPCCQCRMKGNQEFKGLGLQKVAGGPCCTCDCPIIVDTSGNGFDLTSAASGVTFDMSGTASPVQIAWTTPDSGNAFLCLPDSNGRCDDGKHLFGNFTPQPQTQTPNGFLALALYDLPVNGGNGDGIIDSRDAIFSQLRLWIDRNHDGISQPDEIYTLPALGVYSMSLNYKEDRKTDQYGNVFRYHAQINPGGAPGSVSRMMYDVFLLVGSNTMTAQQSCPAAQPLPLIPEAKDGRLK